MKVIRQLPSPAMLVACAAMIVALGGVSYAAGVLPKNSVGTVQLKRKAVTTAKLKKNAVTSGKVRKNAITTTKVKNGTLLAQDFEAGQLPAGPEGPKGDLGPKGDKGDPGKDGAPGVARAYGIVRSLGTPPIVHAAKNLTGVHRMPGYAVGGFCVEVSPSAGIPKPNQAPSIATGASSGMNVVVNTRPTSGNGCDPDEVPAVVSDLTGAVVDRDFTLLVP